MTYTLKNEQAFALQQYLILTENYRERKVADYKTIGQDGNAEYWSELNSTLDEIHKLINPVK